MKKLILFTLMLICGFTATMAQKPAEIKFDTITHNFGEFSKENPIVSCKFKFTNVGEEPLVINQAVPSCGCTVPKYPKEPIEPGKGGEIEVTYNGTGKSLGPFKKSIPIRTNGAVEISRLYIEGDMKE